MASPSPELQVSKADWDAFVALGDGDRRELVDGKLEETEAPTLLHEWVVGEMLMVLKNWARERNAGTVLPSGYKLKISADRGVMPDISFIRRGRRKLADEQGMSRGAPDLAIEVISPGSQRHDRIRKLARYASAGVAEYWLLDPLEQTIQRFVLGADARYIVADALAGDAVFSPSSFEGLQVRLLELWTLPDDEA